MKSLEKLIANTEVTLITKKSRKEFKVFVSWFDSNSNKLCGWYTNRYGKLDIKQFDMSNYDMCL